MNDLPSKLRKYYINGKEWYGIEIDVLTEAAERIEAQNKIIVEMRTALQQLALNLAAEGAIASRAGQMESLEALSKFALKASKSNPNTPERNDE